jgi:hypothetical protein
VEIKGGWLGQTLPDELCQPWFFTMASRLDLSQARKHEQQDVLLPPFLFFPAKVPGNFSAVKVNDQAGKRKNTESCAAGEEKDS